MFSLADFVQDSYCLVVDPSAAFCSILQSTLESVGIDKGRIFAARHYDQAVKFLEERQPKMLICEYQIEKHFGLSLIEKQEKFFAEDSRIAVIVANNSADSSVAEAAEEQVDAYLLKPLSADILRQRLHYILQKKSNPSLYSQKIKAGKDFLLSKAYADAAKMFTEAKALNEKPSLACFYAGQAELLSAHRPQALQEFQLGRSFQPLHYKCITAEFEVLMEQKHYDEAYQLVNVLTKNFPLTPRRLKEIFIASVHTRNFADIGRYFDLYMILENKSADLSRVAAHALFTAARFYIDQKKLYNKAFELFEQASVVAVREFTFVEKIVLECLKIKAPREAKQFLSKVKSDLVGTPNFNRLQFKIDTQLLPRDQVVERGRKLISEGDADAEVFQTVIQFLADDGKVTMAESLISKAVQRYPDLRAGLYKLLETAQEKRR